MKNQFGVFLLVMGILAAMFAVKSGVFQKTNDKYSEVKLPEEIDFNFHIKPILSDNCFTCHGPDANKRKAGLRLDLPESALMELPENPGNYAIVPGKPGKSLLHLKVITDDPDQLMPPEDSDLKLNTYEKKLLKKWIEQGAQYKKHWAYVPPVKSEIPENKFSEWEQNEIDAFVLQRMEQNELKPSIKANNTTLIRRISLDITGLPPKKDQVQQFLSSTKENSIEKVINQFLASPAYGERMTQAWLDIARYADSHGYQDDSYRSMWPWRDWVIHAFNENLPYDEFLIQQLAGDLLPDATKETILATGFNRNHPITQEGGVIQEEYQSYYVSDRTNTLGKGVLGLTLECAKCHDHKYDVITQKNYFEMYAFFNNVDEKGFQMNAEEAKIYEYFADAPFMSLSEDEMAEGALSFINNPEEEAVEVMVMNDSLPRETFLFNRGEYDDLGEKVEPNTPEEIFPFSEELPKNRLGLAKWITDKNHPLTARVYVNRIWAMLFGKGLVLTADNFGAQGSLPTHPQLLDWLARDFMENDWDIKYLLKKIMLSATYQQTSIISQELKTGDPENEFLTRAPRFRMTGEMIRDYVLATSSLLNNEIGGPSVKPYQPPGLWEATKGKGGLLGSYEQDEGQKLYRRSLYTFWKRTSPPPGMTLFDAPNRDVCEVRRQKTNTPLQALALQNDIQMLEAARVLAQKILVENEESGNLVSTLFQRILIRKAKEEELAVLEDYYRDARTGFSENPENAKKLISIGEFDDLQTDPVQTAALMLTAQVVYNLDETINKE